MYIPGRYSVNTLSHNMQVKHLAVLLIGHCTPEMTMSQRVTGHGSSGSTNLSGSRGSRVSTRDPLTRDFVFFQAL